MAEKGTKKKQDLAAIYNWIVDDVVAKIKPEFVAEGVDECVT